MNAFDARMMTTQYQYELAMAAIENAAKKGKSHVTISEFPIFLEVATQLATADNFQVLISNSSCRISWEHATSSEEKGFLQTN